MRKTLLFFTLIVLVLSSTYFIPSSNATTTLTLNPIADVHVESANPNDNFNHLDVLSLVNCSLGRDIVYIRFNLSDIPRNVKIISAKLKLKTYYINANFTVYAHFCSNNSWSESELTWNNRPDFSSVVSDTVNVSHVNVWHNWTITQDVQSALDGGQLTEVLDCSYTSEFKWVSFYSRESAYKPELLVEYSTTDYIIPYNGQSFLVTFSTNSTISNFAFNQTLKQISFNVNGSSGTNGFCNVTIPLELLNGEFTALIDDAPVSYTLTQNSTHSFIYFEYAHSTTVIPITGTTLIPEIQIIGTTVIPEFPSTIMMPIILVILAVLTISIRQKLMKNDQNTTSL